MEVGVNQVCHVTSETLEDKLLYDDVFVDYFNMFLQLEAFEISMRYEKLDGFYLEESKLHDSELQELVDDRGKFFWQGAIMLWVKEHRLPYFLRSKLFLEFKLCKLLLRKLSENARTIPSELGLRGYSQADSPLPLSHQWISNSAVDYASEASWPRKASVQHYTRPLGSANSLPAMMARNLETRMRLLEGPLSKRLSARRSGPDESASQKVDGNPRAVNESQVSETQRDENEDIFDSELLQGTMNRAQTARSSRRGRNAGKKRRTSLFTPSVDKKGECRRKSIEPGRRRTQSAPANGALALSKSHCDQFLDELSLPFGEDDSILAFDGEDDTEVDLQSIVDDNKRNLQDMKEDALKSTLGMSKFRDFLKGTSGIYLFDFWIDVERYKDLEESNEESQHTLQLLRINLFRKINDKYKNYLTSEAKQKLTEALNHDGLTKDLFTRTQYDMLRRLRSYWIPRFLVHLDKTKEWRLDQDPATTDSRCASALSFLPVISFVHSLPPRGDWCTELARRSCDWSKNLILTRRRVRSPVKRTTSSGDERSNYDKFISAMTSEKDAGWPFRSFLDSSNKKVELANLLFWQSIEDLKNDELRGCDRHLQLCNAWSIVKQHLGDEADLAVDLGDTAKEVLIERLRKAVEVSSTLFKSGQAHALTTLKSPWDEYRTEDRETLTKSIKIPNPCQSSSGSRNDNKHGYLYYNFFSTGKWYPRYPESSPSERQRRLHTALTVAENIQATRTSLRSPQKSQPSTRKGKSRGKKTKSPVKEKPKKTDQNEDVESEETQEQPPPDFADFLNDKTTMTSFKHYIQNTEGRHGMNNLSMFLEIEAYVAISSSKREERQELAVQIYKDFFDSASRKNVDLPARIPYEVENECPSTPILRAAQQYVLPDLQTSFEEFHKNHQAPNSVTEPKTSKPINKTTVNKTESSTAHNAPSLPVFYYKRRRNKLKGPGRVAPTKEDKQNLIDELRATSGQLSVRLELFKRYLDINDDVQGTSVSKLENDLLFYLEVQKFKDLFPYMDDMTVTKKADTIVDCFLDSSTPPSVQIDVSSDLAGRLVHKVQSLRTRSKLPREQRDAQIFDDAQNIALKELLPFWAGFVRLADTQDEQPEKLPPTRREVTVKRRYSDFKKFPMTKRTTSLRCVLPGIGESKRELNFTIAEGLAWKEGQAGDAESVYSHNVHRTSSTRSGTRDMSRDQSLVIS